MQFPNLLTLYNISCCATLTSVPCEEGFSIVNWVKSERKERMKPETLNELM